MSYKNTYLNMNTDGTCKPNFKQCGDKTSKHQRGICVPTNRTCPLTSVKISSTNPDNDKYNQITGQTLNLYFSSDQSFGNPLLNLILREDHVCVGESERGITPGRKDYILMTNQAVSDCTKDQRYSEVGESLGELDLLNANSVRFGNLPNFDTSNNSKWKKFSRNIIEFDPRCNPFIQPIIDMSLTIQKIFGQIATNFVKNSKKFKNF